MGFINFSSCSCDEGGRGEVRRADASAAEGSKELSKPVDKVASDFAEAVPLLGVGLPRLMGATASASDRS